MQQTFEEMNVQEYGFVHVTLNNGNVEELGIIEKIKVVENFLFIFTATEAHIYNTKDIQKIYLYGKF